MTNIPTDPENSILSEAQGLVHGDRNESYGHPFLTYQRTANIFNSMMDKDLTARDVGLLLLAVKLARMQFKPKRDNYVDAAGYLEVTRMIEKVGGKTQEAVREAMDSFEDDPAAPTVGNAPEWTLANAANFMIGLRSLAEDVNGNAVRKGFWEKFPVEEPFRTDFICRKLLLIVEETTEATKALREGNPESDKINGTLFAEELADTVIRILDLAAGLGIDLGDAILQKHEFNKERPYKHGRKF